LKGIISLICAPCKQHSEAARRLDSQLQRAVAQELRSNEGFWGCSDREVKGAEMFFSIENLNVVGEFKVNALCIFECASTQREFGDY
jgi:hypothetical protein